MRNTILFTLFIALVMSSCSTGSSVDNPQFVGELTKRHSSLKLLLSDEFSVAPISDASSAATYSVQFERESKKSTIKDINSGQIVFNGRASRHNDVWLLEHDNGDGSYQVSALRVKDNYLEGWQQLEEQMGQIHAKVKNGELKFLAASRDGSGNQLNANGKQLAGIYLEILDSSSPEFQLVGIKSNTVQGNNESNTSTEVEEEDRSKLIRKIHPNPADSYTELDLNRTGEFKVEVKDQSGTVVFQSEMNDTEMSIATSSWEIGDYTILVKNGQNEIIETGELTVSR